MPKEKFRYYMNRKKVVHGRPESWFSSHKDGEKVYWNKITTVKPKNAADQYCYVKVIIKESDNQLIKEEILECADGRKRADGPTYWELFAEFYYTDMAQPEYCRRYSRNKHAFYSPGKVCLKLNGEWEVR